MIEITTEDVVRKLKEYAAQKQENAPMPIEELSEMLGISTSELIPLITTLENEDRVMLQITTDAIPGAAGVNHHGTVKLMQTEL